MAVTCTYVTQVSSTSNASTYTFSTTATGTAASDRINTIGITSVTGSSPNTAISSATINGVTAAMQTNSGTGFSGMIAEIWDASNPTGTTGDIVVNHGEGQQNCVVGVWAVYGAETTPSDTDGATGTSGSIDLTGLTVPTDGCGIVIWQSASATATTWTGADERYDVAVESREHSGADTTTAGSNTINSDGANAAQMIRGIAYGPLGGQPTWARYGGVPFMGGARTSQGAGIW